jgi:CheY-like chemotaxis protein
LADLKGNPKTQRIPVVVVTLQEEPRKALALGADAYCVKPFERQWLLETVRKFTQHAFSETLLIIDDDPGSRYALARCLASTPYRIEEAANGSEGLFKARAERPHLVFLDLHLPDMTGFEVLDRLQTDAHTQDIPVILYTAQTLDPEVRRQLAARDVTILQKEALTDDEVLALLASIQRA